MWRSFKPSIAALLCAAASQAGPAWGADPSGGQADSSLRAATYSASGPAIIRLRNGDTVEIGLPRFGEGADFELAWNPRLVLDPLDRQQGWRIREILCDSEVTNACLVERRQGGRSQWARLDLSDIGSRPEWREFGQDRLLDYNARASTVLRLVIENERVSRLEEQSLVDPGSKRQVWAADETNSNAQARFLPSRGDGRAILLVTGGPVAQWQVIDGSAHSFARSAPGAPQAVFSSTIYFAAGSAERERSWFGYAAIPRPGADWTEDRLIFSSQGPSAPAIAVPSNPGQLLPEARAGGFLANGALIAVTQTDGRLALAEICRPSPGAAAIARPLASLNPWSAGAADLSLRGGAPGAGALLAVRSDLAGQLSIRALLAKPAAGPAQAIRLCGETEVMATDLELPPPPEPVPDLARTSHTVQAPDGADISYDVLQRNGQVGRILIRPYGAYAMSPERFLARPLERDWVARGNTLVVPRLRGDDGPPAWVEAGRGDHKQRAATDLVTVSEDVLRRHPSASRVSLVGISAGAFVSARAALARPDLFDRVVLISGFLDLAISEAAAAGSFDRAEFGAPEGGFAAWLGGRPAPADAAPRFIVLHGSADEIVPVRSAASFVQYARSLGYVVQGRSYEGIGHELADAPYVATDVEALW